MSQSRDFRNLGFVSGSLALLMLTGCDGIPVPISQIQFDQNSELSGQVELVVPDARLGQSQRVEIAGNTGTQTITVPGKAVTNQANLTLKYVGRKNLPDGMEPREATITVNIRIDGKKKNAPSVKVFSGAVDYPSLDQELADVTPVTDCNNLVASTVTGETLNISFKGFQTLDSCQGKRPEWANPEKINQRDLSIGKNSFSPNDDVALGEEFAAQFISENSRIMLSDDHPITRYGQQLMDRIAAVSDNPNGFKPKVHVINANVLNAFAIPGGNVFVFRGLLESTRNESEVVGVLGHEWTHVVARHGTITVTRAIKASLAATAGEIAGIILEAVGEHNHNPGEQVGGVAAQLGSQVLAQIYLTYKSRKIEAEADEIGSQYAYAMDYQPYGLATIFQTLIDHGGEAAASTHDFLIDHPALPKRIQTVYDLSALFYKPKDSFQSSSSQYEIAKSFLTDSSSPRFVARVSETQSSRALDIFRAAFIGTEEKHYEDGFFGKARQGFLSTHPPGHQQPR